EWDLESNLGQRVQDQGRRVPTEETAFIYNAARINLNLHSSVFETGLDREGAFINPRTFEIASCAAFQLVDQRDPLRLHFEPEVELAEFFDINDLREKIVFYLDRPDLRKEMGLRAQDRILAEHTYQHRMKAMIEFILARV
ncbi:MAG: glycosyltransferase family 1 protein, partial [Deltaproteobacteria bacterium]|nr:glycosyltransferase family 1 protein [Deltaproteobacteria bacterium]